MSKRPACRKGTVIADGPSTDQERELALGRNVLVAFMPWEGYNYEDAILISDKLVEMIFLPLFHIEEHECDARDTKLGPEEITGIFKRWGRRAQIWMNGDYSCWCRGKAQLISLGKVTKGETELTAEERLLRAILVRKPGKFAILH